jgi:hypothetical protein
MEQLLLMLFGRKPIQKFKELKFVKKQYPIRELNQKEFERWCNEFRVGSMYEKRVVHFDIG